MANVEEQAYSGLAVQRTNVKMAKISAKMKTVRSIVEAQPDITDEELTQLLYPEWETFTREDFENKEWYVTEKLRPLLDKSPEEVYQEVLDEEQAKMLSIDDAKAKFTW